MQRVSLLAFLGATVASATPRALSAGLQPALEFGRFLDVFRRKPCVRHLPAGDSNWQPSARPTPSGHLLDSTPKCPNSSVGLEPAGRAWEDSTTLEGRTCRRIQIFDTAQHGRRRNQIGRVRLPPNSGMLRRQEVRARPPRKFARLTTILGDTDRARSSRNPNTPQRRDERREGTFSGNLCVRPVSAVPFLFREFAQGATILADTESATPTYGLRGLRLKQWPCGVRDPCLRSENDRRRSSPARTSWASFHRPA